MDFAQNLKYLRIKAGESQKTLGDFLGVSKLSICRYENSVTEPNLQKLVLISEHYNVSIDELLTNQIYEHIPLYAKNIKFLRNKNNMTQTEMAELLGYKGKQGYSAVETGVVSASIESLNTASEYFGVTMDQLVKERDSLKLLILSMQSTHGNSHSSI